MSGNDTKIEKSISSLIQNESFQETEKILNTLKNDIVDQKYKEQITTLLNNMEALKTAGADKITDKVEIIYDQLKEIKNIDALKIHQDGIDFISTLTEKISGFKTELFDLKEDVVEDADEDVVEDADSDDVGHSALDKEDGDLDGAKKSDKNNVLKRGGRALIGLGGFLGIRWARRKLKERRERKKAERAGTSPDSAENNDENSENKDNAGNDSEKPKKKGFWRRALKWAGIGTGVYTGYKLFKGDWTFKGMWEKLIGKDDGKEDGPEVDDVLDDETAAAEGYVDFMKDPDNKEKVEAYSGLGNSVNDFYDDIYKFSDGSLSKFAGFANLGEGIEIDVDGKKLEGNDKYLGAIPYVLDSTYRNIDEMNNQKSLFQLLAKGKWKRMRAELIDRVGITDNRTLEFIARIFGYKTITELLNGKNEMKKGQVDDVNLVFQKILKVMAYVNFAENARLLSVIQGKRIQKKGFTDDDGDETREDIKNPGDSKKQSKLIHRMSKYPESYRISDGKGSYSLFKDFRSENIGEKKLHEVAQMGFDLNAVKNANPDLYEKVDEVNENREKLHTGIENDKGEEVMDILSKSCKKELGDSLFQTFTKAIPILTLLEISGLGSEEILKKKYMKSTGFKELVQEYQNKFKDASSLDKKEQKKLVDEYLTLIKEIETTSAGLHEVVDEHGNLGTTIRTTLGNTGDNVKNAFTTGLFFFQKGWDNMTDGEIISGTGNFAWGAFYAAGAVGAGLIGAGALGMATGNVKAGKKMIKNGVKLSLSPIVVPIHTVRRFGKLRTVRHALSSKLPNSALKLFYKNPDKISRAMKYGLSFKKAYSAYTYKRKTSEVSPKDFLEKIFRIEDTGPMEKRLLPYLFEYDVDGAGNKIMKPAEEADAIWSKRRRNFITSRPEFYKINRFTLKNKLAKKLERLAKTVGDDEILRKLVKDRSIRKYNKINQGLEANPDVLELMRKCKSRTAAFEIAEDFSKKISNGEAIDIKHYEKIIKNSKLEGTKLRKLEDLSNTEKKFKQQLDNAFDEVDKAIKQAEKVGNVDGLVEDFKIHKSNLIQIKKNLFEGSIDNKITYMLADIFSNTSSNPKVQMKLIAHLADDASDIHKSIALLNDVNSKNVEKAKAVIKKLLGATDGTMDDIVKSLGALEGTSAFKRIFKQLKPIAATMT